VFGSLCPNEFTLSVLIILMQRGWFTFLVVTVLLSLFIVVGTFQNYSVLAPFYKTAPTMTNLKNVTKAFSFLACLVVKKNISSLPSRRQNFSWLARFSAFFFYNLFLCMSTSAQKV